MDDGPNLGVTLNHFNNNNDSGRGWEETNESCPDTTEGHIKSETTTNNDNKHEIENNNSGEKTGVDTPMVQSNEDGDMVENPGVTDHEVMSDKNRGVNNHEVILESGDGTVQESNHMNAILLTCEGRTTGSKVESLLFQSETINRSTI